MGYELDIKDYHENEEAKEHVSDTIYYFLGNSYTDKNIIYTLFKIPHYISELRISFSYYINVPIFKMSSINLKEFK